MAFDPPPISDVLGPDAGERADRIVDLLVVSGDLVRLPDGRHLGFAEFGDPHGRPILWFHGTPGGKRQIPPNARDLAADRGIRLIGVERPGTGHSTSHRYDALVDFADDISVLADHLGITSVAAAVGGSMGGMQVLEWSVRYPNIVESAIPLASTTRPLIGPEQSTCRRKRSLPLRLALIRQTPR